jgi:glycosyltransferase involved in cell wall biosynthesis
LFGATRFAAIRSAALAATNAVIERLDTTGVMEPIGYFGPYWNAYSTLYAEDNCAFIRAIAPTLAFVRSVALSVFPGLLSSRIAKELSAVPFVIAPIPFVASRIQQFITKYTGVRNNVYFVPFPIESDIFKLDALTPKECTIISVGRWNAPVKDVRLVVRTMAGFLREHFDWKAIIVGADASRYVEKLVTEPQLQDRFEAYDNVTHTQLATLYSRARIYLLGSRTESACLACSEALVMGCSAAPDAR